MASFTQTVLPGFEDLFGDQGPDTDLSPDGVDQGDDPGPDTTIEEPGQEETSAAQPDPPEPGDEDGQPDGDGDVRLEGEQDTPEDPAPEPTKEDPDEPPSETIVDQRPAVDQGEEVSQVEEVDEEEETVKPRYRITRRDLYAVMNTLDEQELGATPGEALLDFLWQVFKPRTVRVTDAENEGQLALAAVNEFLSPRSYRSMVSNWRAIMNPGKEKDYLMLELLEGMEEFLPDDLVDAMDAAEMPQGSGFRMLDMLQELTYDDLS